MKPTRSAHVARLLTAYLVGSVKKNIHHAGGLGAYCGGGCGGYPGSRNIGKMNVDGVEAVPSKNVYELYVH